MSTIQELIGGYSTDIYKGRYEAFRYLPDLFNGKLVGGESESGKAKTSVRLEVPLGGYVDFLTLNNSNYMVFANVLSGIVVGAMETAEAWTDFVKTAAVDLEYDKIQFALDLLDLICEKTHLTADSVIEAIMEIIMDSMDPCAIATEILGYLFDQGVSLTNLFEILSDSMASAIPELVAGLASGALDAALNFIPVASVIKKFTDTFIATGEYALLIKDLASMIKSNKDFLIIVYPTCPIN